MQKYQCIACGWIYDPPKTTISRLKNCPKISCVPSAVSAKTCSSRSTNLNNIGKPAAKRAFLAFNKRGNKEL